MQKQLPIIALLLLAALSLFPEDNTCDKALKAADAAFAQRDYSTAYKEYENVLRDGCLNGVIFYHLLVCAEQTGGLGPADRAKNYFYAFIMLKAGNSSQLYIEDARKKMYPADTREKEIIMLYEKAINLFCDGDYAGSYRQYSEAFRKREVSGIAGFDFETLLLYQYGFACEEINGLTDEAIMAYFASYGKYWDIFRLHEYYQALISKMKEQSLDFLAYAVRTRDSKNFKAIFKLAGADMFRAENASDTFFLAMTKGTDDMRALLVPYFFEGILTIEKQLHIIDILFAESSSAQKGKYPAEELLAKLVELEKTGNLMEIASAYKLKHVVGALASFGYTFPADE